MGTCASTKAAGGSPRITPANSLNALAPQKAPPKEKPAAEEKEVLKEVLTTEDQDKLEMQAEGISLSSESVPSDREEELEKLEIIEDSDRIPDYSEAEQSGVSSAINNNTCETNIPAVESTNNESDKRDVEIVPENVSEKETEQIPIPIEKQENIGAAAPVSTADENIQLESQNDIKEEQKDNDFKEVPLDTESEETVSQSSDKQQVTEVTEVSHTTDTEAEKVVTEEKLTKDEQDSGQTKDETTEDETKVGETAKQPGNFTDATETSADDKINMQKDDSGDSSENRSKVAEEELIRSLKQLEDLTVQAATMAAALGQNVKDQDEGAPKSSSTENTNLELGSEYEQPNKMENANLVTEAEIQPPNEMEALNEVETSAAGAAPADAFVATGESASTPAVEKNQEERNVPDDEHTKMNIDPTEVAQQVDPTPGEVKQNEHSDSVVTPQKQTTEIQAPQLVRQEAVDSDSTPASPGPTTKETPATSEIIRNRLVDLNEHSEAAILETNMEITSNGEQEAKQSKPEGQIATDGEHLPSSVVDDSAEEKECIITESSETIDGKSAPVTISEEDKKVAADTTDDVAVPQVPVEEEVEQEATLTDEPAEIQTGPTEPASIVPSEAITENTLEPKATEPENEVKPVRSDNEDIKYSEVEIAIPVNGVNTSIHSEEKAKDGASSKHAEMPVIMVEDTIAKCEATPIECAVPAEDHDNEAPISPLQIYNRLLAVQREMSTMQIQLTKLQSAMRNSSHALMDVIELTEKQLGIN
ncbi:probable serine/threonine-protein kinase kinX [Lingula anatina]|uniref:Probable serine/threonine-protein kinase kinX n=1 Tax=Lingula anatina TaxID=7574 RepID=A0A1S3IJT2_LINAN|nr:probable serine/threonine-protein kinase kinX [Lingula anatina]|eukprot:XP_013398472.1 probable serine/threonine-protein kinase kinX [Lingula anatina]